MGPFLGQPEHQIAALVKERDAAIATAEFQIRAADRAEDRAERAEAENAKLRAALKKITEVHGEGVAANKMFGIAFEALKVYNDSAKEKP